MIRFVKLTAIDVKAEKAFLDRNTQLQREARIRAENVASLPSQPLDDVEAFEQGEADTPAAAPAEAPAPVANYTYPVWVNPEFVRSVHARRPEVDAYNRSVVRERPGTRIAYVEGSDVVTESLDEVVAALRVAQ